MAHLVFTLYSSTLFEIFKQIYIYFFAFFSKKSENFLHFKSKQILCLWHPWLPLIRIITGYSAL